MTTSQNPEYGQSAVFEYVNNSNSLNMALRADADFANEQFGPLIRDLDETMSRTPNITESITVYRGLAGGDNLPEGFDGLQAGDVFSDSAFVSTSLSPNSAIDFAIRGDSGIVFEIKVPANSEGIFPNSWLGIDDNDFFDEFEFLLPRDSQFKVISAEGKVWRMELTNG